MKSFTQFGTRIQNQFKKNLHAFHDICWFFTLVGLLSVINVARLDVINVIFSIIHVDVPHAIGAITSAVFPIQLKQLSSINLLCFVQQPAFLIALSMMHGLRSLSRKGGLQLCRLSQWLGQKAVKHYQSIS